MILKSFDFQCDFDFQITTSKMILILNHLYLGDLILILKSSTYDDFAHLCLPGTGAGEKCDVVPVVSSPVAAAVKKFSSTQHASHSTKEQQRKRNMRNNSQQTTH